MIFPGQPEIRSFFHAAKRFHLLLEYREVIIFIDTVLSFFYASWKSSAFSRDFIRLTFWTNEEAHKTAVLIKEVLILCPVMAFKSLSFGSIVSGLGPIVSFVGFY